MNAKMASFDISAVFTRPCIEVKSAAISKLFDSIDRFFFNQHTMPPKKGRQFTPIVMY